MCSCHKAFRKLTGEETIGEALSSPETAHIDLPLDEVRKGWDDWKEPDLDLFSD